MEGQASERQFIRVGERWFAKKCLLITTENKSGGITEISSLASEFLYCRRNNCNNLGELEIVPRTRFLFLKRKSEILLTNLP